VKLLATTGRLERSKADGATLSRYLMNFGRPGFAKRVGERSGQIVVANTATRNDPHRDAQTATHVLMRGEGMNKPISQTPEPDVHRRLAVCPTACRATASG
jgi:hypothetical protein